MRSLVAASLVWGGVSTVGVGVARADEVDQLGAKVVELDGRVSELTSQLKPPPEPGPELAERRLIDAQVLYELKNYESASIILFDVVEKFPKSLAFPEALFYLADSLYLKRDFLSSRKYFEKVVDLGPQNPRYAEALQRLIELSLHTGDYSPVDGYIEKLDRVAVQRPLPTVPYVKGKYFYFRQQHDKAIEALKTIGPDHPYSYHATYFIGASYVAMGPDRFDDAVAAFSTLLKPLPQGKTLSDAQKLIVDLARMAAARIYLERGQLTQALDEYTKIGQKSDQFNDMLYESAWVAIKAKDYPRARRQLDLLLLNAPNSPLAPEVKLLIGSLHIRQNEYGPATDSFTKTRDEFEPVHRLLETELQKTPNPPAYFKDLITKNLSKFDVATILPPSTSRWLKDEPEVVRVSTLIADENDLKKSLDESEEIVKRLEKALSGPSRVNVFPELAAVRAKATEIANELTEGKRVLAARESKLIEPVIGGQKAELDALSAERARLEQALAGLPAKSASIQERMARQRAALNELDKKASEMSVEVTVMQRTIAGLRKLYREAMRQKEEPQVEAPPAGATTAPPSVDPGAATYAAKADDLTRRLSGTRGGIDKTKERLDKLKDLVLQKPHEAKAELEAVAAEVEAMRAGIENVRKDILDAASSIGVDDAEMQAAAQLRAQYEQLLTKQRAVVVEAQSRLSGADRAKAEQIRSILDRARAVDGKIATLNAKIDEILDVKLKDIQVTLAEEKALVADHQQKLAAYTGESADVGGAVVAESWKAVTNRFYNIVVRADVGIIDVAWALKDAATRETNRLVAERKRELKLLDDEFKEVLKEQP